MHILIVHEVDYFHKPVFEFQILAEIFSSQGHKITVIDYPQGKLPSFFSKEPASGGWIASNVRRVYQDASLTVIRPLYSQRPFLRRISYSLNFQKLLQQLIESQKIDFILLYAGPTNGWQTVKLAKRYRLPIVFRSIDVLHKIVPNLIFQCPTKISEKYIYQNSNLILALTPKLRNYIIKFGANPLKVKLQISGVDTNLFKPATKNLDLSKKWGLDHADKIVLFAGTLYKFSTLDWLTKNWRLLLKKIPQAKLLILGMGPLLPTLETIIKKNRLEKTVILTGWQPYRLLPDFINLADVCINLFKLNNITRDIIPTKLFQYLACGKPVIAFPLPGTVEILPGEKAGMVYAKDNQSALNLITKLLENKNAAWQIGRNGYQLTKEKYDWKKIAEHVLETAKTI